MTETPRRRYSQELWQQAVTMTVEDGFGVTETAPMLYIYLKKLDNFAARCRLNKQEFTLKPAMSEQDVKLARLKKENVLLRRERDILKKAAAYFAIEIFYNRQRRQAAPGYLSPAAFVRSRLINPKLPIAA